MIARARAEKARRAFNADITIVLQFDASPTSSRAGLTSINRNIFFVEGAYTAKELSSDARQRLKLLTKLLENVTPTETRVAVSIARCFEKTTGFPPVLYGDTATTRAVAGTPYVVARNLALDREHNGPVLTTEPYFMNQPVTLRRLLAGDYRGTKLIAGKASSQYLPRIRRGSGSRDGGRLWKILTARVDTNIFVGLFTVRGDQVIQPLTQHQWQG